jgi:hypothetical protein
MDDLRVCPFCGNEAHLVENDGVYSILCKGELCFLSFYHEELGSAFSAFNKDLLIKAWNTRIEETQNPFLKARKIISI